MSKLKTKSKAKPLKKRKKDTIETTSPSKPKHSLLDGLNSSNKKKKSKKHKEQSEVLQNSTPTSKKSTTQKLSKKPNKKSKQRSTKPSKSKPTKHVSIMDMFNKLKRDTIVESPIKSHRQPNNQTIAARPFTFNPKCIKADPEVFSINYAERFSLVEGGVDVDNILSTTTHLEKPIQRHSLNFDMPNSDEAFKSAIKEIEDLKQISKSMTPTLDTPPSPKPHYSATLDIDNIEFRKEPPTDENRIPQVEEEPKLAIEEEPKLILEEPKLVIEEEPKLVIEEEPKLVIEEEPKLVIEDKPKLAIEDEPKLVIEDEPKLILEEEPKLILEDEPTEPTRIPASPSEDVDLDLEIQGINLNNDFSIPGNQTSFTEDAIKDLEDSLQKETQKESTKENLLIFGSSGDAEYKDTVVSAPKVDTRHPVSQSEIKSSMYSINNVIESISDKPVEPITQPKDDESGFIEIMPNVR